MARDQEKEPQVPGVPQFRIYQRWKKSGLHDFLRSAEIVYRSYKQLAKEQQQTDHAAFRHQVRVRERN